jgi:phosphatidylglycerophosphate synthase
MAPPPGGDSYEANDRRPIPARELGASKRAAAALAKAGITANQISVAGMGFGILSGILFASTACVVTEGGDPTGVGARLLWIFGALCVALRLLANMFDGMVAVATGTASPVGELYNEVPDRISDTATLVGIGYALGGSPVLGWAAATAAMLTAYVRAVGKGAGAPSDFRGPMAKQHRMFTMIALGAWMGLTPVMLQPQLALSPKLGGGGFAACVLLVVTVLSVWTSIRRLAGVASALKGVAPR